VTQVGPSGDLGGLQWGSATDNERIYAAVSNSNFEPWELVENGVGTEEFTSGGLWSALDTATGQILWQTADTGTTFGGLQPAMAQGAVTVANGVVYACSLDTLGHMYAFDAATGDELWSFASGGSCNAGAAVVNGTVYWGSGYSYFAYRGTTGNDKLYAFEVAE